MSKIMNHYTVSLKRPDGRQESVSVTASTWDGAIRTAKKTVGLPADADNEVLMTCQKATENGVVMEEE